MVPSESNVFWRPRAFKFFSHKTLVSKKITAYRTEKKRAIPVTEGKGSRGGCGLESLAPP